MKKAIGFVILLLSLALMDGTPIHNHHGKYISARSKFSLHESYESTVPSSINEDIIADQDDDDHLATVSETSDEFFQRIHNAPYAVFSFYSKRTHCSESLYRLLCDLRI